MIRKAAMKVRGRSGLSGLDADSWKRIFLSKNFGESLSELSDLAKVTKKLCTEEMSTSLEGFLACRIIPHNKNPGLRPIGVGKVLRRIIEKVIVSVVRSGIISSVGSLQVYTLKIVASLSWLPNFIYRLWRDELFTRYLSLATSCKTIFKYVIFH